MINRFTSTALAALALLAAACDKAPPAAPASDARLAAAGTMDPHNARALANASLGRSASGVNLALIAAGQSARIGNGTIEMYVNREGHLNTYSGCEGGSASTSNSGCQKGLVYLPTNTEATAPGCLCEGWGAGADGVSGYADIDAGGVRNIRVISFTENGTKAVSKVGIDKSGAPFLEVTQDYHPSTVTPNLYEVTVTLKNVSGAPMTDVRYTRAMDWDIGPTTFSEYVTIQGVGASNLLRSDNNGFDTPDPYGSRYSYGYLNTNVVDAGPDDHGAIFDFGFGGLAAGAERTFNIYYGAAGSEPDAITTITNVHAEVYSFGQPSHEDAGSRPGCGPGGAFGPCDFAADHGKPNTFIFAFASVGGVALNTPPTPPSFGPPGFVYRGVEGSPTCLDITASDPDGDPLSFLINWGDGSVTTETSKKPCHVYKDGPATYTGSVTVVADDGHGGTASGSTNVVIANANPVIKTLKLDVRMLNMPKVGQSFWAEYVWSDPGVLDAPWTWTMNWGDGTSSTGVKTNMTSIIPSHTYATPGSRTATLTIVDKDGGSVTRSIPVNVQP